MNRTHTVEDTYVDDLQVPHRQLIQSELHLLFSEIEDRVMRHYMQEDNRLFAAREQAEECLAQAAKAEASNAERIAELDRRRSELLNIPEDATAKQKETLRHERGVAWQQYDALLAPKRQAEADFKKAQQDYWAIQSTQAEANITLAYLAGQRDGLRRGLQIAGLLASGAAVAGIDHAKAALLVAGAMVDDSQADTLISTLLQGERRRTDSAQ